jgi:hypothetical protein
VDVAVVRLQGVIVTPEPGFVIKTKHSHPADTRKVFINVCSSEHVGKPSQKTKLDEEGKEQQVWAWRHVAGARRVLRDALWVS